MYSVGETVGYSYYGVCNIEQITKREVGGNFIDYYVLKPVFDDRSTIYVPVKNEKLVGRMRAPLTRSEAEDLLSSLDRIETIWIDNDNERKENYRTLITEGIPSDMAKLYKTLVHRRRELEGSTRKLRSTDENYLREAEKILVIECEYAAGMSKEDIETALSSVS